MNLRLPIAIDRLLLGLVIGAAWGCAGYAQTTPSSAAVVQPRRRRLPSLEEQLKKLTEVLSLDSTQQSKVKMILDRRQAQLLRVREEESLSAVDRFNAIQAVHDRADDQISAILRPEQASKFEQIRHHDRPHSDGQSLTNTPAQ